MREPLPMASKHTCLLDDGALAARMGEWRALGARALGRVSEPGVLVTRFPRAAEGELRRLIAAEADCCSFLAFAVREHDGEIEVELRYPEGFHVDAIFARA